MTQREFAAEVLFWFGGHVHVDHAHGGASQRLAWAKRYREETGRESPVAFDAWDDAAGEMVRNEGYVSGRAWTLYQTWADAGRRRVMDEARYILDEVAP